MSFTALIISTALLLHQEQPPFKFIQRGEIKCHIYLGDLRGFSLPQHDADDNDGDDGGGKTTINWLKDWRRDGGGNEDGDGMSLPTSSSSS